MVMDQSTGHAYIKDLIIHHNEYTDVTVECYDNIKAPYYLSLK